MALTLAAAQQQQREGAVRRVGTRLEVQPSAQRSVQQAQRVVHGFLLAPQRARHVDERASQSDTHRNGRRSRRRAGQRVRPLKVLRPGGRGARGR